jgi:hypothetical protein
MNDELSKRQAASRFRVAGEGIPDICRAVQYGESWFHKWWQRYLTLGPEGLYDLTRANQRARLSSSMAGSNRCCSTAPMGAP